jgi:hypothetical protein
MEGEEGRWSSLWRGIGARTPYTEMALCSSVSCAVVVPCYVALWLLAAPVRHGVAAAADSCATGRPVPACGLYFQVFHSWYLPRSPGKGHAGFEPLQSGEPPALAATRKSRQHKNRVLVKVELDSSPGPAPPPQIGAAVLTGSAALACLALFLLTRGQQVPR